MADNEQLAVVADGPGGDTAAPADPSDEVTDLVSGVTLAESTSAKPAAVAVTAAEVEKVSAPSGESEVSQPVPSVEATAVGADLAEVQAAEAVLQTTEPVPSTQPLPSTQAEQSTQQELVEPTPAAPATESAETVQSVPHSSPEAQSSSAQEGQTSTEANPESSQAPETPAAASEQAEKDATPATDGEKTPKTPKTSGEKKLSFCKTS